MWKELRTCSVSGFAVREMHKTVAGRSSASVRTSRRLAGRFSLVPASVSSSGAQFSWLLGHADPAVSHLVFLRAWRQVRCSLRSMPEPRDGGGEREGSGIEKEGEEWEVEQSSEPRAEIPGP